jgi:hypothetical protein
LDDRCDVLAAPCDTDSNQIEQAEFGSMNNVFFDVSRSNCSDEIALSAKSDKVPELAGGMRESHGTGNG